MMQADLLWRVFGTAARRVTSGRLSPRLSSMIAVNVLNRMTEFGTLESVAIRV
ncbi:MAG: hypothetical protein GWP91_09465 [Rhodobacterales bacterium]|nr:hypothetical protein [Rhodobacterales bacterium]